MILIKQFLMGILKYMNTFHPSIHVPYGTILQGKMLCNNFRNASFWPNSMPVILLHIPYKREFLYFQKQLVFTALFEFPLNQVPH